MGSDIIEVNHLTKRYGDLLAVDDICFKVKQGELFAFLGANGAGKSTTIEILCTLLGYDAGEVFVGGCELRKQSGEIRKKIGVVFQSGVLDATLTVGENLRMRGGMYGLKNREIDRRIGQLQQYLDIAPIAGQRYGQLSGGQKRKADIARALIHVPDILFLDEPTTGLDPETRKHIWAAIATLQKEQGMTVFLTTHYMEEVAKADYAVIMNQGRIVTEGSPNTLKDKYAQDVLYLYEPSGQVLQFLNEKGLAYEAGGERVALPVHDYGEAYGILKALEGQITSCELVKGSMDDVFLNVLKAHHGKADVK